MLQEHLSKDLKQKVFEVTYALYRVAKFFPENEALAHDLRQEASDILKASARYSVLPHSSFDEIMEIISKLREIRSLLWLARADHLVSSINLDVLEREYHLIEDFFAQKVEHSLAKEHHQDYQEQKAKKQTYYNESSQQKPRLSPKNARNSTSAFASATLKPTNERHALIMDILKEKDKLSIKDIAVEFKDVSTKTIQRDLQDLIGENLIERAGDRRWAIYSLKLAPYIKS